ncbi:hypothetical protein [Streptomyces gossypii]|nr:hypothetical protein [Streptomyces gossypii]
MQSRWRDTWLNKPMRLVFHCTKGDDQWIVPLEVDVPTTPVRGL